MRFIPFQEPHTDLLLEWLSKPHIKNVWQENGSRDKIWAKYKNLPKRHVYPFVIEDEGQLIGYIQYYDATKVGGGCWPDEKTGTYGVDLMIGDATRTGKGQGPKIIKEFLQFVKAREPSATSFIIDPEPSNARAIRAFEKAGFEKERQLETPGGTALLMRLTCQRSKAT